MTDKHNLAIAALRFIAMPTEKANAFRTGSPDANGNSPERMVSDGSGLPCRHCLRDIPAGRHALLLAWRPFSKNHAYAETGPVFLCETACEHHGVKEGLPEVIAVRSRFMLRGYDANECIVDGSGAMVETPEIIAKTTALLNHAAVQSVHVRSGTNTCFICRIER